MITIIKIFLFMALINFGVNTYSQSIKAKTLEVIKTEYGIDILIKTTKYFIPKKIKYNVEKIARQRFYSDAVYVFKIFKKDSLLSIGLLDNVYGKSLPITFLVLFNNENKIISTHVIKYREPYGGGVKLKNWNNQFKGLDSKSSYKIGKNIINISGATISVRSLTKGINKLAHLFKKIKNKI